MGEEVREISRFFVAPRRRASFPCPSERRATTHLPKNIHSSVCSSSCSLVLALIMFSFLSSLCIRGVNAPKWPCCPLFSRPLPLHMMVMMRRMISRKKANVLRACNIAWTWRILFGIILSLFAATNFWGSIFVSIRVLIISKPDLTMAVVQLSLHRALGSFSSIIR